MILDEYPLENVSNVRERKKGMLDKYGKMLYNQEVM